MMDGKKSVNSFFECLYCYMQSMILADDKNVKNLAYFQKLYKDMEEAFASSKDACCIDWERMWKFLYRLQIMNGDTENEEIEVSQEIFAKYVDIDVFFGILYQCMMMFMKDAELNENNKRVIKNIFEMTKEKSKNSKYADRIPWDWMWKAIMNSEVFSRVVEKERKNRGDSYFGENLYSGDETFLIRLMHEDTKKNSYSSFVCVLKSDYIGFDIPNTAGNDDMKGLRRRFQKIIQKLDEESQIEKIFTYRKEGLKRPVWEVSAVNAKAFYKEIDTMGFCGTTDYRAAADLYAQFCSDDGWEVSYERIKELIECFTEKGDCCDWYKEYKRLDRVEEILCQLVPMVSYEENGNRFIKTYSRWREDCEKIVEIVREKN